MWPSRACFAEDQPICCVKKWYLLCAERQPISRLIYKCCPPVTFQTFVKFNCPPITQCDWKRTDQSKYNSQTSQVISDGHIHTWPGDCSVLIDLPFSNHVVQFNFLQATPEGFSANLGISSFYSLALWWHTLNTVLPLGSVCICVECSQELNSHIAFT